jgi:hypothetical protein
MLTQAGLLEKKRYCIGYSEISEGLRQMTLVSALTPVSQVLW